MAGYQSITLADLRGRLNEFYESVPFWTDADANDALNEGLRFWNALTGRWMARVLFETTPGDHTYALPAGLTYRTRVLYNGTPMSPSFRTDLNLGQRNWYTETTVSGFGVPTKPTLWAPRSLDTIDIWPADAAGHNSLVVDGVAATPVLVNDGDFVDLSEADVSLQLGYALHTVSLKKGGPWFASTMPYFKALLAAAGAENRRLLTSTIYRRVMGLDNRAFKPLASAGVETPSVEQLANAQQAGPGGTTP